MNQQNEKLSKAENLDLEFKEVLCIIRERIPYINSNAYLMQCRVWLEKLSGPNVNKVLRNLYLIELCGQIQKNKLLAPFNEFPPTGSLKSLTKYIMNRKSCKMLFQNSQRKRNKLSNLQNASIINATDQDAVNDPSEGCGCLCPQNTQVWKSAEFLKLEREKSVELVYQNIDKSPNNTFECGEPSGEPIAGVRAENEKKTCSNEFQKPSVTKTNDDSWTDLTDGSLEAEFFCKRKRNQREIRTMKINEHILRNSYASDYIQSEMEYDDIKLVPLSDSEPEVTIIKSYDAKELNFKTPRDTNYISEDWKNTIDALQLRLSETTQQNNELKVVIQKLESQMVDITNTHKEETDQTIKTLTKLQSEEIPRLKKHYADRILQLEISSKANIKKLENDHQEKMNKVIADYQLKISAINNQNEEVTGKKDDEISRLTEVIQQQCTRIANDISTLQNQVQVSGCGCDKKLHLLKKCVSKMDKLFQRSEKEYLRQIDKLRQELEVKDTALQVYLKMQKAELIAKTLSPERQEEFDKIVNSLEVKYIKMLEMHESQIMEMKKQDDEKIQFLNELLNKHGILFDEH